MMIIHGLPAAAAPAHLLPWHRASFPKREPPFTRAETPASLRGCVDGHTCCHAYRGHFCMRLEGPGESRLPVVGYHLPSATFWWWSRQSQAKKHNLNGQGTYWLLYQVLHKSSHSQLHFHFEECKLRCQCLSLFPNKVKPTSAPEFSARDRVAVTAGNRIAFVLHKV